MPPERNNDALSIIVISIQMSVNVSHLPEAIAYLGDDARAISLQLRQRDSMSILGPACFGTLLPGVNSFILRRACGTAASQVLRYFSIVFL